MFQRSDDYMAKITMDALDREVILDAVITFQYLGSKLKAFCEDTGTYVQFPRALRNPRNLFIADVIKAGGKGKRVFYHAYKGSIRTDSGRLVA